MNKVDLIRNIVASKEKQDKYLETIPSDIRDCFFDNVYCAEYSCLNSTLVSFIFDEDIVDLLNWFLYDWKSGYECTFTIPETRMYIIYDVDDFLDMLKCEYPKSLI